MLKNFFTYCLIFALVLSLTACSPAGKEPEGNPSAKKEKSSQEQEKKENELALLFPANMAGRTKSNAKIFDIKPFHLKLILPDGWSVSEKKGKLFPLEPGFSIYIIMNRQGSPVGHVGYNVFDLHEGDEDNPMLIYGQIDKGSRYCFDVHDTYQVIRKHTQGETAIVTVFHSDGWVLDNQGNYVEKGGENNIGILSYDKSRRVYVAFDLVSSKVTKDQAKAIAESLEIHD